MSSDMPPSRTDGPAADLYGGNFTTDQSRWGRSVPRKPYSLNVIGEVPSASPPVTGGIGVLAMSQGKEFTETRMGG